MTEITQKMIYDEFKNLAKKYKIDEVTILDKDGNEINRIKL